MSEDKTTQYPPDYTGHEDDPTQEVTVWETEGTIHDGFEFTWWKSQDDATQHITDWVVDKGCELIRGQLDTEGKATLTITVRRVTTTVEEADGVFEG